MGRRIAILLAAAATAAVCLSSLGAAEAGAVDPPGKRVKVKMLLGEEGGWGESAEVRFNPGWRGAGRNIKAAWVRFSAGGTAKECRFDELGVCQPFDYYRAMYSYGTSCTTGKFGYVPSSSKGVGEVKIRSAPSNGVFTFSTVMRVKFPTKRRKSCEIVAGISSFGPSDLDYPYDFLPTGKALLKTEVFVKKK